MRQSIIELCVADHRGDPALLTDWLTNKTLATFETWVKNDDTLLRVAEQTGEIVGVASANTAGQILLNYVSPNAQFSGVSSALLARLEQDLLALSLVELSLWSTQTAHHFYRARGWVDAGKPASEGGAISYPMRKSAPVDD